MLGNKKRAFKFVLEVQNAFRRFRLLGIDEETIKQIYKDGADYSMTHPVGLLEYLLHAEIDFAKNGNYDKTRISS